MIRLTGLVTQKPVNTVYTKNEMKHTSLVEGASTEEKRIVMMAIRKQMKYRRVGMEEAIMDVERALGELKVDVKNGKIKK